MDEGALHAYLDGALDALPASEAARIRRHLASCEACAGRLEEERSLRAEAATVLAGADPGVGEMPALEELRRRAAARTGAGAGSRLRQLAWAASIVMAVGAGWMLRGSRDPRISEALDPRLRQAVVDRAAAAPAVESAAESTAAPEEVPQAGGAAPVSGGGVPVPSAAPVADVSVPAGAPASRESVRTEPTRTEPTEVAEPQEKAAAPLDTLQRTMAAVRGQVASILADSVTRGVAPSLSVTAAVRSEDARADEVRGAAARPRMLPRASEEEPSAVRRVGSDLGVLSVPGLPVLSVARGEQGLPAGTLRVRQLLESDTLELLHLPAGADPSDVAGPVDGSLTQVVVRYGAGWLIGRARTSAEALEELLARVTGGG